MLYLERYQSRNLFPATSFHPGADVSNELPAALEQARTIVAEQLMRLRAIADSVRAHATTQENDLRQAERMLDEATMQIRFAAERGAANNSVLRHREAQARKKYDSVVREAEAARRAMKELEQLIRQIEMSSASLGGAAETVATDPWAQALRAQVIHGREEERVRLAREVHDGPAQVLVNTLMGLAVCQGMVSPDEKRLADALVRLHDVTKEGLTEVRRFIADLRPAQIDKQGLVAAIHEYVRGHQNTYGTNVTVEAESVPRLPAEAEIVIYRIVQESLQNAHKHARGARITIKLGVSAGKLSLSVRDDGPGFDPRSVIRRTGRESWGLMSMRERAELIGARLAVASRPGYGTEVSLELPLSASK